MQACQNCKQNFVIEPEDFLFYEKINVPPPTFCPECRLVRRMMWRNERFLYKRSCNSCEKKIIAMYPEKTVFPVYCIECWRSDKWDAIDQGRDYDFSKPFFEQWLDLFNSVPRPALGQNGTNINAEYANFVQDVKNVYLSTSVIWNSEDVYYSTNVTSASKNIVDSLNIDSSEFIYESIGCTRNYRTAFCFWSRECIDSAFLAYCVNVTNCIGCVNLRNVSYHIFNKKYTKEEFEKKKEELALYMKSGFKAFKEKFKKFMLEFPVRYANIVHSVNSTGDDLYNCKNVQWGFSTKDAENVKYSYRCPGPKDSMDVTHLGHGELIYEHAMGGSDPSRNCKFIIWGSPALEDVSYSDFCASSSNLFGCIGLKNKSYCILNKKYSKEDYEKLMSKIIDHMNKMPYTDKQGRVYKYGEFFPIEFSPFGYNESVANMFFPLLKEEAQRAGYKWTEKEEGVYIITKKASELPESIRNIDEDIIKEIISSEKSGRAYRILPQELALLKQLDIAVPTLHHDERFDIRFSFLRPLKLWHRKCQCAGSKSDNQNYTNTIEHFHEGNHCPNEFETSYSPDRPEIVYCEKCYQAEVV